jgi:phage FluMu protein Com
MPFKSAKQERFFGMCAGGKGTVRMKCPPRKVIDKFFAEERKTKGRRKK